MPGKVTRVSAGDKDESEERIVPGLMEQVRLEKALDTLAMEIDREENSIEQIQLEAKNLNRPPPVAIVAEKKRKIAELEAKKEEKVEELLELGRRLSNASGS